MKLELEPLRKPSSLSRASIVFADINLDLQDADDLQSVHIAILNNDFNRLKELVEDDRSRVNLTVVNGKQWSPLLYAVEYNRVDMISYLIDSGANVNYRGADGKCIYHIAVKGKAKYAIVAACKANSDVNAVANDGLTPLLYAAAHGSFEIGSLLIGIGAKVNIQDKLGKTPLHYTCAFGNIEFLKALLGCRAKTNIKDITGRTPLDYAAQFKHTTIVDILNAHKAKHSDSESDSELDSSSEDGTSNNNNNLNESSPTSALKGHISSAINKIIPRKPSAAVQRSIHPLDAAARQEQKEQASMDKNTNLSLKQTTSLPQNLKGLNQNNKPAYINELAVRLNKKLAKEADHKDHQVQLVSDQLLQSDKKNIQYQYQISEIFEVLHAFDMNESMGSDEVVRAIRGILERDLGGYKGDIVSNKNLEHENQLKKVEHMRNVLEDQNAALLLSKTEFVAQISALEATNKQLQTRIAELNEEMSDFRATMSNFEESRSEDRVEEYEMRLEQTNQQIKVKNSMISNLRTELSAANDKICELSKAINSSISSGPAHSIHDIETSEMSAEAMERLEYLENMVVVMQTALADSSDRFLELVKEKKLVSKQLRHERIRYAQIESKLIHLDLIAN